MAWMFIPLQTLGTSVKAAGQTQHGDNLSNQKVEPLGDKGPCGWMCPIPLSRGKATPEELWEGRLRAVFPH